MASVRSQKPGPTLVPGVFKIHVMGGWVDFKTECGKNILQLEKFKPSLDPLASCLDLPYLSLGVGILYIAALHMMDLCESQQEKAAARQI